MPAPRSAEGDVARLKRICGVDDEDFAEILSTMGIANPVTKKVAGAQYHRELARQLAETRGGRKVPQPLALPGEARVLALFSATATCARSLGGTPSAIRRSTANLNFFLWFELFFCFSRMIYLWSYIFFILMTYLTR